MAHSFPVGRCVSWLPWWLSGKECICQCRRCEFDSWFRKIPRRTKRRPSPVFLPGNPKGRGTSWAMVHGVKKESAQLSDQTTTKMCELSCIPCLNLEMTRQGKMTFKFPSNSKFCDFCVPQKKTRVRRQLLFWVNWLLEFHQEHSKFFVQS